MSRSSKKKDKVRKITEEEYAKYVSALKANAIDTVAEKREENEKETQP